ncbi:MAG: Flp family type IVb pilin [Caldilineaceae bacterium]
MLQIWMVLNTVLGNLKSEKGQGLAEYALIIVLVSIAVVITLGTLGDTVNGVFESIVGELAPA